LRIPEEETHEFHSFSSIQEVFTRSSFPPRTLPSSPTPLLSPVQGVVTDLFPIREDRIYPVKGNPHSLTEILGSRERGKRFLGGTGITFYLRPKDYHRIHSPLTGKILEIQRIPGGLYPVNRWGRKIPKIFLRNERWVLEGVYPLGRFAMVWVGAFLVGSLRFTHRELIPLTPKKRAPILCLVPIQQGEELGLFAFGSSVVLFLNPSPILVIQEGEEVKVGTPLSSSIPPYLETPPGNFSDEKHA
jgi:phosphatidylserine decarboxylase